VWSSISPFHRNPIAAPGRRTYAASSGSKGVGHDTGNPVGGGRIGGGGPRGSGGGGAHGDGPDHRAREARPAGAGPGDSGRPPAGGRRDPALPGTCAEG